MPRPDNHDKEDGQTNEERVRVIVQYLVYRYGDLTSAALKLSMTQSELRGHMLKCSDVTLKYIEKSAQYYKPASRRKKKNEAQLKLPIQKQETTP